MRGSGANLSPVSVVSVLDSSYGSINPGELPSGFGGGESSSSEPSSCDDSIDGGGDGGGGSTQRNKKARKEPGTATGETSCAQ